MIQQFLEQSDLNIVALKNYLILTSYLLSF